jgi:hypothetical protein
MNSKSALPKATGAALTISEVIPPEQGRQAPPAARRRRPKRKRVSQDHLTFAAALSAAEKRLPEAIREQAEAAATYTMRGAEISGLQNTIYALRNWQRSFGIPGLPGMGMPPSAVPPPANFRHVTLDQVMSDAPIPAAQPQAQTLVPTTMQAGPQVQMPVVELPYIPGRGGGGAVGFGGAEPAQEIDEDEHLKGSAMAGGTWI